MKLITLNVSDEKHMQIKTNATKAGLSMKEYLLGDLREDIVVDPQTPPKTTEQIFGLKPTPLVENVSGWKPCKHGEDPKFCKFSKPGKPCK